MRKLGILLLLNPTPGDDYFLKRWQKLGRVYREGQPYNPRNIEILVTGHDRPITEELLSKLPDLLVVASPTTGHTHFKFDPDKQSFKVITLRGETEFLAGIRSVSEFTLQQILNLSRPSSAVGNTVNGKTLGILGLGRIGRQVEALAGALGMKVYSIDKGAAVNEVKALFRVSDFVSVHLPENASTFKFVSKYLLSLMPKNACLINTARASIVDEQALADALNSGAIRGAAIDLVEDETILNSKTRNLIITPHIAGFTLEDRIKTDLFLIDKILKFLCELQVWRRN